MGISCQLRVATADVHHISVLVWLRSFIAPDFLKTMYRSTIPPRLVYDVVEKKHRLVVEVESLASSSKKYIKSRRTFNSLEILAIYL